MLPWVPAARGESEASLTMSGRQPRGHQRWVHRWTTEYPTVRTLIFFYSWSVRRFRILLEISQQHAYFEV